MRKLASIQKNRYPIENAYNRTAIINASSVL